MDEIIKIKPIVWNLFGKIGLLACIILLILSLFQPAFIFFLVSVGLGLGIAIFINLTTAYTLRPDELEINSKIGKYKIPIGQIEDIFVSRSFHAGFLNVINIQVNQEWKQKNYPTFRTKKWDFIIGNLRESDNDKIVGYIKGYGHTLQTAGTYRGAERLSPIMKKNLNVSIGLRILIVLVLGYSFFTPTKDLGDLLFFGSGAVYFLASSIYGLRNNFFYGWHLIGADQFFKERFIVSGKLAIFINILGIILGLFLGYVAITHVGTAFSTR